MSGSRRHSVKSRRLRIVIVLAVAVGLAGAAIAATTIGSGRIGPASHITANGRLLQPPGQLVALGHFPTGGALTPDGRFYWTVSTGRALNDIRIVAVGIKHPRVIQILPLPGASGGIAIDGTRSRVYVSGVADSTNTDQQRPGLRGRGGDVIHVFSYNRHSGIARESGTIAVPPPPSAPVPQNFPPKKSGHESWPDRLAVSPNGRNAARAAQSRRRGGRDRYALARRSLRHHGHVSVRGGDLARRPDGAGLERGAGHGVGGRARQREEAQGHPGRREPLSSGGDRAGSHAGRARTWRSPTRTRSRSSTRDA